jgi:hypothetical protein
MTREWRALQTPLIGSKATSGNGHSAPVEEEFKVSSIDRLKKSLVVIGHLISLLPSKKT